MKTFQLYLACTVLTLDEFKQQGSAEFSEIHAAHNLCDLNSLLTIEGDEIDERSTESLGTFAQYVAQNNARHEWENEAVYLEIKTQDVQRFLGHIVFLMIYTEDARERSALHKIYTCVQVFSEKESYYN